MELQLTPVALEIRCLPRLLADQVFEELFDDKHVQLQP